MGKPNYEKDLEIDKHRLDEEFVRQPVLFMEWAGLAAEADAKAKRAAEKVKTIRSEIVITAAREGIPSISKPTGLQIEAYYRTNSEYKEVKEEMIDAEETAALLQDAVWAFRQRKNGLEKLAELHLAGYYSSPRAPQDSGIGSDEGLKERADDKVKQKSKRRK